MVSVGALTERKGFHRVIEGLPVLVKKFPNLIYLIIGGAGPEGNWGEKLRAQAAQLGLADHVIFLGALSPDELKFPLSAADVFVLATRNEGWANVFLEAMACGLPVVTTDVGGNREVVTTSDLGTIVEFGDGPALERALADALRKSWDRSAIVDYARANSWDSRVNVLVEEFSALTGNPPKDKKQATGARGRVA